MHVYFGLCIRKIHRPLGEHTHAYMYGTQKVCVYKDLAVEKEVLNSAAFCYLNRKGEEKEEEDGRKMRGTAEETLENVISYLAFSATSLVWNQIKRSVK
jgi:hypothetical protein